MSKCVRKQVCYMCDNEKVGMVHDPNHNNNYICADCLLYKRDILDRKIKWMREIMLSCSSKLVSISDQLLY
jgi:hypothetical protein